jgi:hypothetical protein
MGCCFGERFIHADVFIDYSSFVSDTSYNQYFIVSTSQRDTSLNNPFSGFNSLKGFYLSLIPFNDNDSLKVIIELNQSGHRDTFTYGKYAVKNHCKIDTYDESVLVNGVRKYGKLITIKP